MHKLCRKCNEAKHHSEFYRAKHTKDGLQVRCKQCAAQAAQVNAKEKHIPFADWFKANGDSFIDIGTKKKKGLYARNGYDCSMSFGTHTDVRDRARARAIAENQGYHISEVINIMLSDYITAHMATDDSIHDYAGIYA